MFASSSRLELGIIVGPDKPSHIKTILSGPLPILIDYVFKDKYVTKSALWRLRAALGYPDRVREISFEGTDGWFEQFFKATNCSFPVLESLSLCFDCRYGHGSSPELPDTFLKGPDSSDLHLRRLELKHVSLKSISGFLSSARTLTDLILVIDLGENPSAQMRFLVCFQSMPCLRSLDLSTTSYIGIQFLPTPSAPKRIVPLSKLTFFRFVGHIKLLDALVAGLSAPSLQDVDISFSGANSTIVTIVHLPRFINGIMKRYHAVHLDLQVRTFNLSLLTWSERINHGKPRFKLYPSFGNSGPSLCSSLMRLSDALSTKLTDVKELRVTKIAANPWEDNILWRGFLQQFPSVKALRIAGLKNAHIARIVIRDHTEPDYHLPFLPALEEIELPKLPSLTHETRSQLSKRTAELALFEPFVSARKRAGRPVKVFFGQ